MRAPFLQDMPGTLWCRWSMSQVDRADMWMNCVYKSLDCMVDNPLSLLKGAE